MSESVPYKNIACSAYDQLEAFAVKKIPSTILFLANGKEKTVEGIIIDLFAKDGAEFLKLDTGLIVRLDNLISVNGISINGTCAI